MTKIRLFLIFSVFFLTLFSTELNSKTPNVLSFGTIRVCDVVRNIQRVENLGLIGMVSSTVRVVMNLVIYVDSLNSRPLKIDYDKR